MATTTSARGTSGMTLLELLLVMGLLGILLGAGVGVLASMNLGQRAAVGSVQNTLRAAHNTAVARGAGARVRIDANAGTIAGDVLEVIGTWHFEGGESLRGAFELDGVNRGAQYVDDGFIGKALSFPAGARAWAEVPVQLDASFDLHDGFRIELAVRAQPGGGGRMLRLGEVVALELTQRGGIRAWFAPEVTSETGRLTKGGRIVIDAPDDTLPPLVWKRVAFVYDRQRLALYVDGLEIVPQGDDGQAAPVLENAPVWQLDGPLVLGDSQSSFVGALDALVISALAVGAPSALPEGVRFDPGAPALIRFDAGGNLDRAFHREPVAIALVFEDGQTQTVRVGLYGTIE